ncbi:MAG: hypothetical protein AAF717_20595 [Bacteroidota bacterium]
MEAVPIFIDILFIFLVTIVLIQFYRATKSKLLIGTVLLIALVQSLLSINGFFMKSDTLPPRTLLIFLPGIVAIVTFFSTKRGKEETKKIDLEQYTYLFSFRFFVELFIFALFFYGTMPESMTYEGRNFDILAGLTAPFIAYYGLRKRRIHKKHIVLWNVIALLLVIQVATTGILSAPSTIQQISFDQPNIAALNFPYILLPGILVPIVVFGHLLAIKKLRRENR